MTVVVLDAAGERVRPGWIAPALVAALVTAAAWWASAPYLVGVFHDDGVYLLLGRAIAEGRGFHYLHLPAAPAAVHYPPLYPVFLAALWRLWPAFPDNIGLLLGANVILLAVAALGLFTFARRRLGWTQESAAVAAVVASISTPTLTLAGAVLSETLFLAALWPALLLAEALLRRPGLRTACACGLAVGGLMLLRTHAVALLGAVGLLLMVRREWRLLAAFSAVAVSVQLPWILWSASAADALAPPLRGAYGSYAGWFAEGLRDGGAGLMLRTVGRNVHEIWLLFADRVRFGLPGLAGLAALYSAAALVVAGMWPIVGRAPVTAVFLAAYLVIVSLLAFAPWRYVWGIWPFVVLLAAAGARHLWNASAHRLSRATLVLAVAACALSTVRVEWRSYATREWERPARDGSAQIVPLVEWVRANTALSDVVLSEAEQMVYLYTGRRAAPPARFTAREYLARRDARQGAILLNEMLRVVPAQYVLSLSPDIVDGARLPLLRARLREIDRAGNAVVFQVQPGP